MLVLKDGGEPGRTKGLKGIVVNGINSIFGGKLNGFGEVQGSTMGIHRWVQS